MGRMIVTPESARAYLRKAIREAGLTYKEASLYLGHDHAYISQYLGKPQKPLWLGEVEIKRLAKRISGLDPDRLRQPDTLELPPTNPESADREGENQPQVNLKRLGQLIEKPGAFQLLEAYCRISSPELRQLALDMINRLASTSGVVAA